MLPEKVKIKEQSSSFLLYKTMYIEYLIFK